MPVFSTFELGFETNPLTKEYSTDDLVNGFRVKLGDHAAADNAETVIGHGGTSGSRIFGLFSIA